MRFRIGPAYSGKEADEEVGLTYFGERYLVARIGGWATPDPLHIHAGGGGEALNSYHYVGGNLLQARDPLGLSDMPEPEVAVAQGSAVDSGCSAGQSCGGSDNAVLDAFMSEPPARFHAADDFRAQAANAEQHGVVRADPSVQAARERETINSISGGNVVGGATYGASQLTGEDRNVSAVRAQSANIADGLLQGAGLRAGSKNAPLLSLFIRICPSVSSRST